MLRQRIGLVVLVWISLAANLEVAHAGSGLSSILQQGRRPQDFYASIKQWEPSVCQPVLRSLNQEYAVTQQQQQDNPNLAADLLLTSRLQLSWKRRLVLAERVITWLLDYSPITLRGNAPQKWMYRWAFYGDNRLQNDLILSNRSPEMLPSQGPLADRWITELTGPSGSNIVNIDRKTVPELWHIDNPPDDNTFILNVVLVQDDAFILAANAIQVENAGRDGGRIDIYVLRFEAKDKMSLICRFRSVG